MRARYWLLIPLLVAVGGTATVVGGWWSYRAVRNRAPVEMSCADFAAHPPEADWVRITGCEPLLANIGVLRFGPNATRDANAPSAVFVPIRPVGAWTRAPIVVFADRGALLALGDDLTNDTYADQLLAQPIEGIVERSLDRSERSRRELHSLGLNITAEPIIIDYDATPRPLALSFGLLGVGVGALGVLARLWKRRRRPVELARATIVAG